ncbi:hypothetical protein AVEN_235888-1 [Araneus ventricosus]|uniref:Uncharacterized protein n=1 Tax=Araneus ventricosus TaxID=182803 RepID=A0A4Y2N4X3_ARAVE|nr:hypothetical protein AVEN_235888-1 [Araneus ventricosus]
MSNCRARKKRLKTEDGKSVTGWISAKSFLIERRDFLWHPLGRPRYAFLARTEDLNKLGARLESVQTSDRERVKLSRVRKKTYYDLSNRTPFQEVI